MSHIFISYARKNKRVVNQFVESLRTQDFIVWQDVSNISAGEAWRTAIYSAIEQASVVVIFWTVAAQASVVVNEEIDHALSQGKHVIPVWLEKDVPLRSGLDGANAVISAGFGASAVQKIVGAILDKSPRIQRQLFSSVDTRIPMHLHTVDGVRREMIGEKEYVVAPLIQSLYSNVRLIAAPGTVVSGAKRVQLMVQTTGGVDWTMVRDVFSAIAYEDTEYPEEAEPLVGLYVTGAVNPLKPNEYWVDSTNVAHYSDIIDSTRRAIGYLNGQATSQQTFQLFQRILVDIAFLLGVQSDRWIPFQVYKWTGQFYVPIINVPARSPN